MGTWNIVLLVLNIVLFIMVAGKITQFFNLYQDNLRIQNSIESLVEQNSQLVNIILDELEGKLQEARSVISILEQRSESIPDIEPPLPVATPILSVKRERKNIEEEVILDLSNATRSKIIYLRQMGLSVQEIAEKLQLSQGEIDLKLNLQEKHSSTAQKLRKLR